MTYAVLNRYRQPGTDLCARRVYSEANTEGAHAKLLSSDFDDPGTEHTLVHIFNEDQMRIVATLPAVSDN